MTLRLWIVGLDGGVEREIKRKREGDRERGGRRRRAAYMTGERKTNMSDSCCSAGMLITHTSLLPVAPDNDLHQIHHQGTLHIHKTTT